MNKSFGCCLFKKMAFFEAFWKMLHPKLLYDMRNIINRLCNAISEPRLTEGVLSILVME